MRKEIYFGEFDGIGWPEPKQLERYFLGTREQLWAFETGNDDWALRAEGVEAPSTSVSTMGASTSI